MSLASLCGPTCGVPLYVHVVGATVLFGGVLAVTILAFASSWRPLEQAQLLLRLAFWSTLLLLVPAWIAMRIGGQWVLGHEHLDKHTPGWANVGSVVSDGGAIVIVLLLVLAWLASRRPRAGPIVGGLGAIYLIALGVAWFAMSAKPSW